MRNKNLEDVARHVLPTWAKRHLNLIRRRRVDYKRRTPLTEDMLRGILVNDLGIKAGSVVFVHSSLDQLNSGFPPYRVLTLLMQVVGPEGTLLFPTYPRLASYQTLMDGASFNVRKSISYTGILTELARRHKGAYRSLHPTKSVCAIGKYARDLTASHQDSSFPYDSCSPYYKIIEYDGIIIGIGVSTKYLSFVHCVDDALKEEFPVSPYRDRLFEAKCINYDGNVEIVRTYAHDSSKQGNKDLPAYFREYISPDVCRDMVIHGREFFRADARRLFAAMMNLAKQGITIYPPDVYERKPSK